MSKQDVSRSVISKSSKETNVDFPMSEPVHVPESHVGVSDTK